MDAVSEPFESPDETPGETSSGAELSGDDAEAAVSTSTTRLGLASRGCLTGSGFMFLLFFLFVPGVLSTGSRGARQ